MKCVISISYQINITPPKNPPKTPLYTNDIPLGGGGFLNISKAWPTCRILVFAKSRFRPPHRGGVGGIQVCKVTDSPRSNE